MKSPRDDLKADRVERKNSPDFEALTPPEELVRGKRTRDDVFDAVLQLHEPATVAEIAAIADHGTDATREYLDWFERMGIVKHVGSSPATYRRNQEYLTWRRIERVRNEYTPEEIISFLVDETERENEFTEAFGVDSPEKVRLADYARDTDTSLEDAWEHLCDWRTVRRRIEILEQALPRDDSLSSRNLPA